MATEVHDEQQPSVAALVSGILHDAQDLIKQQIELFKQELWTETRKAKAAAQLTAVGVGIALAGATLVGIALALGLQAALPELPLWACFSIFGAIFLAVGAGFFAMGMGQIHTVSAVPNQTGIALEENMQWLTNRK